jgi:hypothetical protein
MLVSSDAIMSLSSDQLAIELRAVIISEDRQMEQQYKLLKNLGVSLMGLNLLNMLDMETGTFKDPATMTEEEREAFLPLVFYTARETMAASIMEKLKEANDKMVQASAASEEEDYEKMVADDLADIEPINPEEVVKKLSKVEVADIVGSSVTHQERLRQAGVILVDDDAALTGPLE